jgi:hypothetical protein
MIIRYIILEATLLVFVVEVVEPGEQLVKYIEFAFDPPQNSFLLLIHGLSHNFMSRP